jgi:pimeloyl-ACP methyl ester carboxylesterase
VRFLRRHAVRLRIDPQRIDAAGTSAGAITALNVALHPDDPGASGNPGFSSRVRAAVAIAGFAPLKAIPRGRPPLLILQGTADHTLPFPWAERTCRMVHAGGGACDLVPIPGAGHGMIWARTGELERFAADWLQSRNLT